MVTAVKEFQEHPKVLADFDPNYRCNICKVTILVILVAFVFGVLEFFKDFFRRIFGELSS